MKRTLSFASVLLSAVVLLTASCKKSADTVNTTNNNINATVAKQIAMDIYRVFANNAGNSSSDGLKSNSVSDLKTNGANTCGQVVVTPTNVTRTSGDTTRKYSGSRMFTYLCNGFYNDGKTLDAYQLWDTLRVDESGPGFKNTYKTMLDYSVKAKTWNYTYVDVVGKTAIANYTSKLSGNTVTEWHTLNTDYTWDSVIAERSIDNSARYVFGLVAFYTTITNSVGANKTNTILKGKIIFREDNKLTTMFISDDGQYKTYITDLTTGKVTEV